MERSNLPVSASQTRKPVGLPPLLVARTATSRFPSAEMTALPRPSHFSGLASKRRNSFPVWASQKRTASPKKQEVATSRPPGTKTAD
jgi:hypothetical protein